MCEVTPDTLIAAREYAGGNIAFGALVERVGVDLARLISLTAGAAVAPTMPAPRSPRAVSLPSITVSAEELRTMSQSDLRARLGLPEIPTIVSGPPIFSDIVTASMKGAHHAR